MKAPTSLFVYGTLKAGQINRGLVAGFIESCEPASIPGHLYDLGLFPALVIGDGVVRGELLQLTEESMSAILGVLDRLEGYNPNAPERSMYIRSVVEVTTDSGGHQRAYTYYYNRDPLKLRRLEGGEWTGPTDSVSAQEDPEHATFEQHVRAFSADTGQDLTLG